MSEQKKNLVTISQFATNKETTRLRIYQLINMGVIVPELIADKQFIDADQYADFDPKSRIKREKAVGELLKKVTGLEERVKSMEHILYKK